MVAVKIYGGLGNQMFQYAAALRLSIKQNTNLLLDISELNEHKENITKRSFELDKFNIAAEITASPVLSMQELRMRIKRGELLKAFKLFSSPHPPTLINEKFYHFDPAILNLSEDVLLNGYWQSYRYFDDIESEIRQSFTLNKQPGATTAEIIKRTSEVESVSLHVRRGDYISNASANSFHGTSTLDYYKMAIEHMQKNLSRPHFFIFSDDPEWCKQNFAFLPEATFVDHNPPDQGIEDMRIMMSCRHNILANSSFSWWGAWLNQNLNKIVIAPNSWFNDKSINTQDLIPPTWIRI